MILYHVDKEIVEFPEIRKTKYTKDFSWGFYCTKDYNQAVRWANRGNGKPIVNFYNYEPKDSLSILKFEKMTDEWLDFIAKFTRNHCASSWRIWYKKTIKGCQCESLSFI